MLLKVLKPFLRENFDLHLKFTIVGAAIMGVAKVLSLPDGMGFAYFGPFLTVLLVMGITGGNLSWLLSQPVSKNQLMLGSAVLAVANMVLLVADLIVISVFHSLVEGQPKVLVRLAVRMYRNFWVSQEPVPLDLDPNSIAVFICVLCVMLTLLFPHRVVVNVQAGSQVPQGPQLARKRLMAVGVIAGLVIGVPVAIGSRLLSPFSIFALITLLFPAALMANSMTSLGFSRAYRRVWVLGTAAFCFVCTALPFTTAVSSLATENPPGKRYESVRFLGLFAGSWNQRAVLEKFLKEDLPVAQAEDAAEAYTAASNAGLFSGDLRNWLAQKPGGLQFREVIGSKKDYYSTQEAGKIFDPRSLGPDDLDFYLAQAKSKGVDARKFLSDYRFHLGPRFWLRTPLSPAKVKELLASDHHEAVDIGLIHVRFDPRKEYYDALLAAFRKGIPNRSVEDALYTLSTISTVPYAFRELASLEAGRGSGRGFVLHDCRASEKLSKDLRPAAQAIYGQCQRRKAYGTRALGSENADWIGRRLAD